MNDYIRFIGARPPNQEAALTALRKLTGKEAPARPDAWDLVVKELALKTK